MRNAISQFARFTGVEVRDIDQVFESIYGQRASEVIDPTVTGHHETVQKTTAEVSRIKAKKW